MTASFLEYLKRSREFSTARPEDFGATVSVNIVTNFTDDILKNIFTGVALEGGAYPRVHAVPYRQYHLHLKDPAAELHMRNDADITFMFFDANPFKDSEFRDRQHFESVLADIERYASAARGMVVLNHFIVSYQGAYGNLFREDPWFALVEEYNRAIDALAKKHANVTVFDTNRLVHLLGESHVFEQRGLFAFDIPFTNEFTVALAEEWFAYVRALIGKSKKCIVLDLDNTLWGGVVGELGATGIALGPDYPGNAFVNFQRALLDFYHRGVILAIVSKNNAEDVAEAFARNPHLILKEKYFSAIRTNWDDKAVNLIDIAKELNIGVDSMVFIDDDPVQRAMVKAALPDVAVPDWSFPPEEYARALYSLNLFHQFSLTDEDRQKGKMYAEERGRKQVMEQALDIDAYIASLDIVMRVRCNISDLIPRLAQMTQKTNQFNLTTKRYAEHDVRQMIDGGAGVFSANVTDKFGDYGTVILAIAMPGLKKDEAVLDSFLMSCRVMGRGVECAFIDRVIRELGARGYAKLHASFVPTAKNKPSEAFLAEHGFTAVADGESEQGATTRHYTLDIPKYLKHPCKKVNKAITITT